LQRGEARAERRGWARRKRDGQEAAGSWIQLGGHGCSALSGEGAQVCSRERRRPLSLENGGDQLLLLARSLLRVRACTRIHAHAHTHPRACTRACTRIQPRIRACKQRKFSPLRASSLSLSLTSSLSRTHAPTQRPDAMLLLAPALAAKGFFGWFWPKVTLPDTLFDGKPSLFFFFRTMFACCCDIIR